MDPLVLFAAFGVVLVTWLASVLWPLRRMWWTARNIPGPWGYPLIGNALEVQGDPRHTFDLILSASKKYGKFYRYWLGTRLYVFVNDPADIQEVIGNPKVINKDNLYSYITDTFIGNGLVSSRGDKWRLHRKIMTPMFHFKILQTYVEVFGSKANELCDKLDKFANTGNTVDIYKLLGVSTLEAVCETAIGITIDAEKGCGKNLFDALHRTMVVGQERLTKPWLMLEWLFPYTANGRETAAIQKTIFGFTASIVDQKLREYKSKRNLSEVSTLETEEGPKKITTLLDMMIESTENKDSAMSVQEINDELSTIAVAGFDTTAISLSNLCLVIGLNPHVQDKISQELDEIFQGDLRAATTDDINRMVYLDAVIKETFRYLPTVAALPREIPVDMVLPSGYTLPAGCTAVTFSYAVHRDPRYFVEPERFAPERWLPDAGRLAKARHPYSFLPFAAGPRNCIGQKYAMLQMKSTASSLLRRFTVSHSMAEEDLKRLNLSLLVEVSAGYHITLTRK